MIFAEDLPERTDIADFTSAVDICIESIFMDMVGPARVATFPKG
jgi:hypothetical protein